MKRLNLSRFVLNACVALLLAGCGASQTATGASGVNAILPGSVRTEPAGGGALTGGYSGRYEQSVLCGQMRSPASFTYSGTGKASFLHRSRESGVLYQANHGGCGLWAGTIKVVRLKEPQTSIVMAIAGADHSNTPCGNTLSYTVQGGTGSFANATGAGNVTFSCIKRQYTDTWSGTLYY